MSDKKALVLDTSAFIAGYEPAGGRGEHYTVVEVLEEIRDSIVKLRLQAALDSGSLRVKKPWKRFREEVVKAAEEVGDLAALSPADISILALALQLKGLHEDLALISEDYSVQNVADRLGIRYVSLATVGISHRIVWLTYCPGCRRTYEKPVPDGVCPICGTRLRRKPLRKSQVEE
ncbi:MAG: NOB1 family endonuclease [Candidatus Bathyarchaeia archaeon]